LIAWNSSSCGESYHEAGDANYAMVTKAQELLYREWTVKAQHAYREGDAAADLLGKLILD
jgi:hypothetical protein